MPKYRVIWPVDLNGVMYAPKESMIDEKNGMLISYPGTRSEFQTNIAPVTSKGQVRQKINRTGYIELTEKQAEDLLKVYSIEPVNGRRPSLPERPSLERIYDASGHRRSA